MTSGGLSVVCTSCAKTSGKETPSNCSQTHAAKLLRCLSHGSRARFSGGLDAEPDGDGSSFGGGPPPRGAAGPSSSSSSPSSPSSPSGSPRPRPRPLPRPPLRLPRPRPPPRPRGLLVGSPGGRCEGLPDGAAVPASEAASRRPCACGVLGAVPDGALSSSSTSLPRARLRPGGSTSPSVRDGALGGQWLLARSSRSRPAARRRSPLWSASAVEPPERCRGDGAVRPAVAAGVPSGRSALGPGAGQSD